MERAEPLRRRLLPPLLVTAAAGIGLHPFLREGLPTFYDAHSHLARAGLVAESLAAGLFPGWTFQWYGGYALTQFYAPLYYWIAGTLAWASGELVFAVKVVTWAMLLASALGCAALLRRMALPWWGAALAAALLLFGPLRAFTAGVIGAYPSLLFVAWTPWILAHTQSVSRAPCDSERARSSRRVALFAGQAVLGAAALSSHLYNALYHLPAIAAFQLVAVADCGAAASEKRRTFLALAAGWGAAFALCSAHWLPLLADMKLVVLSQVFDSPAPFRISLEPVSRLLIHRLFDVDEPYFRSPGAVPTFGALAFALASASKRLRALRPLAAGFAVTLLSATVVGQRAVVAFPIWVACLYAAGVAVLFAAVQERQRLGAIAVAVIASLAIAPGLGTPHHRRPIPVYEPTTSLAVYGLLPETPTRSRTFDLSQAGISIDAIYGPSDYSPLLSGRGVPLGGFPQGAPLESQGWLVLASEWIPEARSREEELPELPLDTLYLGHVGFLLDRTQPWRLAPLPEQSAVGSKLSQQVLALRHVSPVLLADEMVPLPDAFRGPDPDEGLHGFLEEIWAKDPYPARLGDDNTWTGIARGRTHEDWRLLHPLVEAMQIDRANAHARRVFANDRSAQRAVSPPGSAAEPALRVLEHEEGPEVARLLVEFARSGVARVSYAYHPRLRVRLDGAPVAVHPDAIGGAFLLPIQAGRHELELRGPDLSLRAGLSLASLIAALGASAVWLRASARSRAEAASPDARAS